jgi:hypothetical protein
MYAADYRGIQMKPAVTFALSLSLSVFSAVNAIAAASPFQQMTDAQLIEKMNYLHDLCRGGGWQEPGEVDVDAFCAGRDALYTVLEQRGWCDAGNGIVEAEMVRGKLDKDGNCKPE